MAFRRPSTIKKIPLHSSVRVLLIDSKVSRNTRTLVDRVAALKKNHDVSVSAIMQVHKKLMFLKLLLTSA